ncbi:FAD-dependent oxidoreductase [Sphingosinicella sp. CPCC 101087]|uniref:FAD-dependent oxidoreductase n=1 Tax=Sphingosinicella sp. CPCC 101087 TaxID=2497754 RepID=UPI0013EB4D24|nr:FAD-dependent oxidoreductase [Sphingosinicella sp. CPCC 101087]
MTRRSLIAGAAAAAAVPAVAAGPGPLVGRQRWDVIVVGAGVFGAWTAKRLLEAGRRVLLLDAWGPAHARASSGGESRMTRSAYGADAVYTRMAVESLPEWRRLSDAAGLPIFQPTGVLFFFQRVESFLEETIQAHRRLGLPTELFDAATMRRRFPQIDFAGVEAGLFEPDFGVLLARRAVQSLVAEFVRAGGEYRQVAVRPPTAAHALEQVVSAEGVPLSADHFVFACGPWLGRLFPDLLGSRIFPTRQEVFFFAPPPGADDFASARLPAWADYNDGDIYYGFPDLEGRGFKIAHDAHGPPLDPDVGDRTPSAGALADVRTYMARRFPALVRSPLSEARVCQYENSSNGDLLIDFHPQWANTLLVGAGSGHGFKHGPAVGRYAADLLLGTHARAESRFSLETKEAVQARAVH